MVKTLKLMIFFSFFILYNQVTYSFNLNNIVLAITSSFLAQSSSERKFICNKTPLDLKVECFQPNSLVESYFMFPGDCLNRLECPLGGKACSSYTDDDGQIFCRNVVNKDIIIDKQGGTLVLESDILKVQQNFIKIKHNNVRRF